MFSLVNHMWPHQQNFQHQSAHLGLVNWGAVYHKVSYILNLSTSHKVTQKNIMTSRSFHFLGPICLAGKSTTTGTISSSFVEASLAMRAPDMCPLRDCPRRTLARSRSAAFRWCMFGPLSTLVQVKINWILWCQAEIASLMENNRISNCYSISSEELLLTGIQ